MSDEPLFTPRGPDFVPTEHTRGPWDPRHQHGGAVAALVARAVERTAGPDFGVTRLTVELMRPVPLETLAIDVSVPRPGRVRGGAPGGGGGGRRGGGGGPGRPRSPQGVLGGPPPPAGVFSPPRI